MENDGRKIEKGFEKKLEDAGYKVYKNGWPDFLIEDKAGNCLMIEFKSKYDRLHDNQIEMIKKLSTLGYNVAIVSENKISKKPFLSKASEIEFNEINLDEKLNNAEKKYIEDAIESSDYKLFDAAKKLSISFDSLRHRMKKYHIKIK